MAGRYTEGLLSCQSPACGHASHFLIVSLVPRTRAAPAFAPGPPATGPGPVGEGHAAGPQRLPGCGGRGPGGGCGGLLPGVAALGAGSVDLRPGRALVLARDPTHHRDEWVALVAGVVYRGHALPVAWHVVATHVLCDPMPGTLVVLHGRDHKEPWLLLTDALLQHADAALYACRHWIEQGFRGCKRGGCGARRTGATARRLPAPPAGPQPPLGPGLADPHAGSQPRRRPALPVAPRPRLTPPPRPSVTVVRPSLPGCRGRRRLARSSPARGLPPKPIRDLPTGPDRLHRAAIATLIRQNPLPSARKYP